MISGRSRQRRAHLLLLQGCLLAPAAWAQLRPYEAATHAATKSRVDELVEARWQELGIEPAYPCSDEVFLRRTYLDVTGTLPNLAEARKFLADRSPDKRNALIDRLLACPEFADYWAMKWADLLRVKAEFPINLWPNAVQAYHRWIRNSIQQKMPYDRFVRELLTENGSCFRVPQVNFYRGVQSKTPEGIAQAVALTFMGTRLESWPAERRASLATFFERVAIKSTQEWKEEIVFFDPGSAAPAQARTAALPDGSRVALSPDQDPRQVFADWLIRADNPWFARNIVNRVWSWLLGRGIVHEPDDLRPDNQPTIPELLRYLEAELVAAHYDLQHVFRLILTSRTYQLSAIPRSAHPLAAATFAHYSIRRLDAEVLIDTLCEITGASERYSSQVPEPFTFLPAGQRAVGIADGSITSAFLEMFGRSPRDTGKESERNNQFTTAQRLHLLNSTHLQRMLENSRKLAALTRNRRDLQRTLVDLFLTVLSRHPQPAELQVIQRHIQAANVPARRAADDVVWALINSAEFLYRH